MGNDSKLRNIFAKNPKQYLMETENYARDVFSDEFKPGTQKILRMSPPKRKEIMPDLNTSRFTYCSLTI